MKEHHFKDDNGKEITPIGPTAWGGDDRTKFYNDLVGLVSLMRNF